MEHGTCKERGGDHWSELSEMDFLSCTVKRLLLLLLLHDGRTNGMVKPENLQISKWGLAIWSKKLVCVFLLSCSIYVLFTKMREVFGYHSLEAFLFQLAKIYQELHPVASRWITISTIHTILALLPAFSKKGLWQSFWFLSGKGVVKTGSLIAANLPRFLWAGHSVHTRHLFRWTRENSLILHLKV